MARSQAEKLTKLTFEKVLEAHPDKSGLVILGKAESGLHPGGEHQAVQGEAGPLQQGWVHRAPL